jgi:hypothetical protein
MRPLCGWAEFFGCRTICMHVASIAGIKLLSDRRFTGYCSRYDNVACILIEEYETCRHCESSLGKSFSCDHACAPTKYSQVHARAPDHYTEMPNSTLFFLIRLKYINRGVSLMVTHAKTRRN